MFLFLAIFSSCMLTTAKAHQHLLEIESPLSSAFCSHLPPTGFKGWWLEHAPRFLEFAEIKVSTFLLPGSSHQLPDSPPYISNWSNLCSTFLHEPSRIYESHPSYCSNKLPTIPHQQAAPGNVHVAGRGWSTLGKGDSSEQASRAMQLACSPQQPFEDLSYSQQPGETTLVPCFHRKPCAAILTGSDQKHL